MSSSITSLVFDFANTILMERYLIYYRNEKRFVVIEHVSVNGLFWITEDLRKRKMCFSSKLLTWEILPALKFGRDSIIVLLVH